MIKKLVFLLLPFFFLTGCKSTISDIHIETIIEEKNNYKISINYPKTGYENLDKDIFSFADSSYKNFINQQSQDNSLEDSEELNIDYTFYENDEFISITLFKTENEVEQMKTYNYNKRKKELVSLEHFTDPEIIYAKANTILFQRFGQCLDTQKIKENLKTPLFSLDQDYLYLYYPPNTISNTYPDFIIVEISLKSLNLEFHQTIKSSKEILPNQVNLEKVNKIVEVDQKVIALTFDDGPSNYTEEILSILEENEAVATFFILGNKVETYQDVLKQSIENGNELGNHTFNHKWLTKLTDEEIKKQIEDTQKVIESTLGYTPTLFRPSYGSINKRVRSDISLDVILWNIDTMDWKYKSVDKIVDRATRNASDGKIILMHETYKRTKDALPKIISILKEEGFEFVTISELKEINHLRTSNGK